MRGEQIRATIDFVYRRFSFEGNIHASLDCVPLTVRRKLDLAGLKISLAGWQKLSREERLALCHLPVEPDEDLDVYREVLRGFAARVGATLTPLASTHVSNDWSVEGVLARLLARGRSIDEARLAPLSEEERYALYKLADPKREPDKLEQALAELGLDS